MNRDCFCLPCFLEISRCAEAVLPEEDGRCKGKGSDVATRHDDHDGDFLVQCAEDLNGHRCPPNSLIRVKSPGLILVSDIVIRYEANTAGRIPAFVLSRRFARDI